MQNCARPGRWDNWHKQENKKAEDKFYDDILKFLRGEPNGISPGTIGMIKAEIAKNLVTSDPSLIVSERREALLEAVNAIYDRDHTVTITLTEQDLAAAYMMAARTDDLSKA
jgi:hypothetical protein